MSRSNWLLILAFGGWLIAGCASAAVQELRPEDENPVGQQTESAEQDKAAFDAAFWAKHSGESDTYRAICESPKDRDYADLCQQWRTAEETKESARWAFPQFAINIVAVFATLAAALAAVMAARSAQDSVKVARENAQRELRAYISATPTPFHYDPFTGRWSMAVEIANDGRTPAYNVCYGHKAVVADREGPRPSFAITTPPAGSAQLPGVKTAVNPTLDDPLSVSRGLLSPETHKAILKKEKVILVFGLLTYKDVFGDMHWVRFRYKIDFTVIRKGDVITAMDGNDTNREPNEPVPTH
jgi:hypothetical protein